MILTTLFGAATPENPRYNLNDPKAWELFNSGAASTAGVKVNRESALTYSPWWRGKNLISRDVAKLPLHVYERATDGGKERHRKHPAYRLLRRMANDVQTALQFKLQLTGHALDGNGYAAIFRDDDARPEALVPLDPNVTFPVRETQAGGEARVLYTTVINGERRKLLPENVLHIKGLGFDGLIGYDVVKVATDGIGLGKAREKFSAKFFSNGAHLNVVLEAPAAVPQKEADEIVAVWNRLKTGLDNSHKTAILTHGLKANHLTRNAKETQLVESMEFSIREIANFLGVPPHKLGDTTRTSFSSLAEENLSYLTEALDFWLRAWEDECHEKLLTEDEKDEESAFVEFSREQLFETDLKTKGEYFRTALAGQAWVTVNQARAAFNMNPVEGGDDLMQPLNMAKAGEQEEEPDEDEEKPAPPIPPAKEEDDEEEGATPLKSQVNERLKAALHENLVAACRWAVRRLGHDATRAAKDSATFMAWLEATPDHDAWRAISNHIGPTEKAANAFVGGHDFDPIDARPANLICRTVKAQLLEFSGTVTEASLLKSLPAELERLEAELPAKAAAIYFGESA